MRKITPDNLHHNAALPVAWRTSGLALVLVLALAMGACSPEGKTPEKEASVHPDDRQDCPVVVDISAWSAFQDLTERIHTGTPVTDDDLLAYGNQPTVTLWCDCFKPNSPSARKVANWVEGAFWNELGRQGRPKSNTDRANFGRSFIYSFQNIERIDNRLANFTRTHRCQLDSLARFWIDPRKLPDPMVLHFLPAKSEIRISEGSLFVDTGVLAAGSLDQLNRQIATLLYRKYGFLPGDNPLALAGELAVAHSFRVFMNEGIAGWIEKPMEMEWDSTHPKLHKVHLISEDFFLKAQETVELMNSQLGPILADESQMSAKGSAFARRLVGMNALGKTGFAMAAVIVGHFGEDRLREVSHSVPDFIAAYQEAALQNPDPAPQPGAPGVELYATVPPLQPDTYARLQILLARVFPQ